MTVAELIIKLQTMPQDLPVAVLGPGQAEDDNDARCYPIGDIEHVDGDSEFVCVFLDEN